MRPFLPIARVCTTLSRRSPVQAASAHVVGRAVLDFVRSQVRYVGMRNGAVVDTTWIMQQVGGVQRDCFKF